MSLSWIVMGLSIAVNGGLLAYALALLVSRKGYADDTPIQFSLALLLTLVVATNASAACLMISGLFRVGERSIVVVAVGLAMLCAPATAYGSASFLAPVLARHGAFGALLGLILSGVMLPHLLCSLFLVTWRRRFGMPRRTSAEMPPQD